MFKRFVEQKWKDALNVDAAEPADWESAGAKTEKQAGGSKKPGTRETQQELLPSE